MRRGKLARTENDVSIEMGNEDVLHNNQCSAISALNSRQTYRVRCVVHASL